MTNCLKWKKTKIIALDCSFQDQLKLCFKVLLLWRYYQRSGTQPPKGSWWNNSEPKYLHISSFGQKFGRYVRKDLRYSLRFLNQPYNRDGDSLTKGGKLSKPENSANQRSIRLMWVET
jgi:hypothetical protein